MPSDCGMTLEELILHKKVTESGCWEWTRARHKQGYGTVRVDGKLLLVHRYIMFLPNKISLEDKSTCVRHSCDNPPCFNPEHLVPGTRSENLKDAYQKGRRPKLWITK